ncbi:MAG: hypothetical protein LBR47_05995 [Spirochaetaceae bacterium]|nr:hypothetical protein [Spirochaetaceae bacterium]
MRLFYLHQRKVGGPWYVTFTNPETGKLSTRRSTGTSSKPEAESIAQTCLRDGVPDILCTVQQSFCDYLLDF